MNPHEFGHFCSESLESAAKCYKTLGFSIIPLNGARNQTQPKLPLIKWGRYQHSIATDEELHTWFGQPTDIGIGIVCGRVSRLMVLDFDDADLASEFRRLHPQLGDTFTVRSGTRGLPHFYYRLSADQLVTTSAYPGADLRGEGAYVVAAPTRVGKVAWVVENDVPVHAVSDFEMRQIMRFLNTAKTRIEVQPKALIEVSTSVEASEFRRQIATDELVAHYEGLSAAGRNQALFRAALLARDSKMPEAQCCLLLAALHARKQTQHEEAYAARYAEALKTIGSAYSRPMRRQDKPKRRLGNSVREWLLTHDLTAVARVLDGLYTADVEAGFEFTALQICQQLARYKIGRRSIMTALKATICDKSVFALGQAPLDPPADAYAANRSEDLNNSCEMSRGAKRVKIGKRGRPARRYRLPSPEEMASLIGIQAVSGDVVAVEHLSTPTAYRAALHTQLIERRPGYYARGWLAARIGVSRWTVRRYEKSAGTIVQPSFSTQTLTWLLAETLPKSIADASYGVFLETFEGKHYPALRGLAFKLLKERKLPVLKQQQSNYYLAKSPSVGIPTLGQSDVASTKATYEYKCHSGVGIPTPRPDELAAFECIERAGASVRAGMSYAQVAAQVQSSSVGIPTPAASEQTFWLCPDCLDFHIAVQKPDTCNRCGTAVNWEVVPRLIWADSQALKHWWQERYRIHHRQQSKNLLGVKQTEPKLTREAISLVERIHAQIPEMSFSNSRRIVQQFGVRLIEKALLAMGRRDDVKKPAGFLMAFLKSEHKLLCYNKSLITEHVSKPSGESAIEWLRRLVKSPYVNFIANADEILSQSCEVLYETAPV